jgi:hypothetical protein
MRKFVVAISVVAISVVGMSAALFVIDARALLPRLRSDGGGAFAAVRAQGGEAGEPLWHIIKSIEQET